jgi:membrane-bound lytic murein transglycosylase B
VLAALVTATAVAGCSSGRGAEAAVEPTTSPTASVTSTTTSVPASSITTTTVAPVAIFALRPPAAAGDPVALAEQIRVAEETIRDPAGSTEAVAEAALAQQVAYRQLGRHPEWDGAVLAVLPTDLQSVARHNAEARREFAALHTKPAAELPAWRIVEPAPIEQLVSLYREAEAAFGIPWPYLAAVHLVETGTGRIRGTSTAGAQGPMQFLPSTWDAYGASGDINDTRDAIMAAARYLAANNGSTDIDHALFRYNNSNHYVRGVKLYADLIAAQPRAFLGYYHWGIWFVTDQGDVYLPVGYDQPTPIPLASYRDR